MPFCFPGLKQLVNHLYVIFLVGKLNILHIEDFRVFERGKLFSLPYVMITYTVIQANLLLRI